ncbi:MAG: 1-deoxy-D-xylulose-5-phosphate reductoisomerase [Candidatus Omnitrophica bacterium]|nr:1-deoxy-D-xylulose-5-phosphate reductoisomerase [Candidatus Omnitrophota bacterium]
MKKILVFGSTGSIGKGVLDILRRNKKDFSLYGLSAHKNIAMLERQVREFNPSYVCLTDERAADKLKNLLPPKIKLLRGETGLEEFSSLISDISVMGISGIAALKPLLINIKNTKRVALANKESMVIAGSLVKKQAKLNNTEILPVDSEINALYQTLACFRKSFLEKIYLTASGGPLFHLRKASQFKKIKAKDVLRHPTWNMGKRISVDSATLVNKGFEVIESHEFFDIDYKMIDVLIHRESQIHSLVELKDGVSFLCAYEPDMRVPIGYALYYPQRVPFLKDKGFRVGSKKLGLTFLNVDYKKFPLMKLVVEAGKRKDNSIAVINAADEVAIEYFLKGKVNFLSISEVIKYMFDKCPPGKLQSLKDVLFWDNWAREKAKEYLEKKCC